MGISDKILKSVKQSLQITWDEEDEDLRDSILQGMAFIESKAGPLDFDGQSGASRQGLRLWREYMRYDWNGYGSTFAKDYQMDILNLQLANAIERRSGHGAD